MRTQARLDAATLESLLTAAVAAPSIHNTQPWRFRLDPRSQAPEAHSAPERTLRSRARKASFWSIGPSSPQAR
ncbi:nitroreductase family protein [Streptomyces scabiei]|uniref:nitroreductase family protein n=1 Tax=Streptomyces scabiei TaxID=1930 RepID=UPI0039F65726